MKIKTMLIVTLILANILIMVSCSKDKIDHKKQIRVNRLSHAHLPPFSRLAPIIPQGWCENCLFEARRRKFFCGNEKGGRQAPAKDSFIRF